MSTDETAPGGPEPTGADPTVAAADGADGADHGRILANSAVMAAGTIFSRLSGFVRSMLLAAALGAGLHADLFTIANTVPNMLYILLAGGIFNAVLVPQLVRAMKQPDGGSAYVDRIVTLAILFLGTVTVLLVVAAPWVMALLLDSRFGDPALAAERQSAIDFARYCLPQVFFYGMFVLAGQLLNARGRFGPMMWAPIANNVIAVGVLVIYLFVFGTASRTEQAGAFTPGQEVLLGIGSTLGIVAQLLILLPYFKSAGIHFRPRFDFRGAGLGHTLRLGVWTVLYVIVNQAAYVVVVRLASGGTAESTEGTGITVYSGAFLIVMVPHSIITVSLATALLPRLSAQAASHDLAGLRRTLTDTVRSALVVVVPFAVLLPAIATALAQVVWGYGATAELYTRFAPTLALFGGGLVFFTIHYLTLRGFYALELNRTVFVNQCWIAATNVALALLLVRMTDPEHTAPMLVLAYTGAYAVGSLLSVATLRRRLARGATADDTPRTTAGWPAFVVRLLAASAVAAAVGWGAVWLADRAVDALVADPTFYTSAVELAVVSGLAGLAFLLAARLVALREVTDVLATVTRRLRR